MNRRLLLLLAAVVAIKVFFLALDSAPSYRFDDSGTYLASAIAKWIPPDRGFLYGFILRPIAVWTRSLMPIVYVQVALSAVAAWLVGFALIRYFAASFRIAAICALACAVEPLQLVSERYVLTEAFGTFVFAIYLVAVFAYLRSGSLSLLALVQVLGVFLVALRLSFLPVVLCVSVLAPLLWRRAASFWRALARTINNHSPRLSWNVAIRFIAIPLVFSIAISQLMLFGYRILYGQLTGGPSGYTHAAGTFLAAEFAPLIQPLDFPIATQRQTVFGRLAYPLSNPDLRSAQRTLPGGLDAAILRDARGNQLEADRLARATALNAIERDPIGVIELAASTFAEYFHYDKLRVDTHLEQTGGPPLPRDIAMMKITFGLDVADRSLPSLTKSWEQACIIWYWFLLILPLVFPVYLALNRRQAGAAHLICAVCALWFLFDAVVPVERPDPRYLTTLAWLAFIIVGSLAAGFARASRVVAERAERKETPVLKSAR